MRAIYSKLLMLLCLLAVFAQGSCISSTTVDSPTGPKESRSPSADSLLKVIVVVIDGSRYTETFGDPSHSWIPFMWNELKAQGTILTNFWNEGLTQTNPGHASLATGTWQTIANDGTERPDKPTFFEYFRKTLAIPDSLTFVVVGKSKLNICSYSTRVGYGEPYGARVEAGFANDTATFNALLSNLDANHPRLVLVNFADVDRKGHSGIWTDYLDAIQTADSLVFELWMHLMNNLFYAGTTYLFITNDHGRHDDDHGGFQGHGDSCEGCRHVMFFAMGPKIREDYVVSGVHTQIDVCPTVGALLGFDTPLADGDVISEMFIPSGRSKPEPKVALEPERL
ncbi:MAG: hypothetical protein GTO51_00440 [Candidatus Latescibacteria bacterium]|nr:hypothetical protein [Candidatus Latescibacterota bacterium]NIM64450.1 hypothetical protein [Candidatus Latescibacterota bacterium]NIO00603.1 hypothetical protein [Candidatus Latescibacterota bacterium]NIO27004.1 hypothetical protein [Candidatus Latescibacterota bacterium]NIO56081.1 hypothetical protein [Candidatus Latescibacterota bacterium]